jgi:dTDP-4-dehydro-6-deoxy-alpha-D-glucopyranose 2,3-dehydratase
VTVTVTEQDAWRFTASAATRGSVLTTPMFRSWFGGLQRRGGSLVEQIPFGELRSWSFDEDWGDLRHETGRFFTIEGIEVTAETGSRSTWTQPIIKQTEIGILGILVKEIDGVLHCLMQAKVEPGNRPLVQLSPTVQATRSNYTRAHSGDSTRYLEYFLDHRKGRVLVDVLQSEQGAWFLHKRNRNMVVEAVDDVPVLDGFRWLTIYQLKELIRQDLTVNMDARTVLSCMSFVDPDVVASRPVPDDPSYRDPAFRYALARSIAGDGFALHSVGEITSWLIEAKARRDLSVRKIPLRSVSGWRHTDWDIRHETGRFFRVLAVSVRAPRREVARWTQPMIEPCGQGLVALLTRKIEGVLHVLVQARTEPGYLDVAEIGPTVQATPDNYLGPHQIPRPPYFDYVLGVSPHRIRYDVIQSDEGGRFYHSGARHLVIEVDEHFPIKTTEDYRWLTVHQMMGLLRHSHYFNLQARSLLACLHTLW